MSRLKWGWVLLGVWVSVNANTELAKILRWQTCDNLCTGQYEELVEEGSGSLEQKTEIVAEEPAFLTAKGISVLQGNVLVKQPGRRIATDKLLLTIGEERQLLRGEAIGNVRYQEPGKLLVVQQGSFDFQNQHYFLQEGYYRLKLDQTGIYAWGKLGEVRRTEPDRLQLKEASITTCAPTQVSWRVTGKTIDFDFDEQMGTIQHAVVYAKDLPVLYLPYYQFMLRDQRKSGLLWSTPYYASTNGYVVRVPIYLNLAPNYDLLFKPIWMSKRGVFFENQFRYLFTKSSGSIVLGGIWRDSQFKDLKQQWPRVTALNSRSGERLRDSSNNRWGIGWLNRYQISPHWLLNWDLHYVSDDYFTYHFDNVLKTAGERDQLLNRLALSYRNDHWFIEGKVEAFQTLHPILYGDNVEQYRQLPSLTANWSKIYRTHFVGVNSDLVVFQKRAYGPHLSSLAGRSYFEPFLETEKVWKDFWNVKMDLRFRGVMYNIGRYGQKDGQTLLTGVPTLSLAQTLHFEKALPWSAVVKQTLEPSLHYFYIPYRKQDHLPLFDTFLPNFDCDQIFRVNRFVGKDRVGDSNRMVFSVTSRFLDGNDFEKLSLQVAQAVAFQKHRIALEGYSDDPLLNRHYSPICFRVRSNFSQRFGLVVDSAWSWQKQQFNTFRLTGSCQYAPDQLFNFWYHYGAKGDQARQDRPEDLKRFGFAHSFNLTNRWQALGKFNYNLSFRRVHSYFGGVSYNSCCWAIRLMVGREFISTGQDLRNHYDTKIYLQLNLKGLTSMDFSNLDAFIKREMPNYQDQILKRGVR